MNNIMVITHSYLFIYTFFQKFHFLAAIKPLFVHLQLLGVRPLWVGKLEGVQKNIYNKG
jgi:hypothetical protein